MSSIENAEKIISNWKLKWDNEINNFDKFICYWIAFNSWYWTFLWIKSPRESDYINWVKKELKDENDFFNDEIESAKKLIPPLKNVTRWWDEVKISDISTLVDFIYTVRNNLFHWNKRDTDDRDKEILKIATPILYKILNKVYGEE